MAEKNIPTTSDEEPQEEINWARKTRDLIAAAFEGSVLKLIDNGITRLEGNPYLSTLIEDEEMKKDQDKFSALCQEIQDLAEKLPEDDYSRVCGKLEKVGEIYYIRAHLGADKMAEILIRFYLQTHWSFPAFGTGSQRITHQKVEQGGTIAKNVEQEEADAEDESATQKRPALLAQVLQRRRPLRSVVVK